MRAERVRRVYARSEIGQRANSLVHDRQGLVPMCDAAPALTRAANIQARFLRSLHHHFKAALLAAMSRTERSSRSVTTKATTNNADSTEYRPSPGEVSD